MKLLVEAALALAILGYIVWAFYQSTRTSDRERVELANLRSFKGRVLELALTETQVDPTDVFSRVLLDEVSAVDRVNSTGKELR